MGKVISLKEAGKHIKSGMSIMMGGFMQTGGPKDIVDEMLRIEIKDITLIANDTSFMDSDKGKLIVNKRVKKAIVSHIGLNPEAGRQMREGEIEIVLTPQGTLAEKIRAGGAGLGGILTPTGIGTIVEEGKQIIEVEGNKFILETALKADLAIIYATKADIYGNLSFQGSTRNFNTIMATAAGVVIVEVDEIVEGALNPNEIVIPGIFVDYIVQGGKN
ncbi:MAG: 3-oxoacid CoA-transferase subunit A [Fusobacteriaceae bacterium]